MEVIIYALLAAAAGFVFGAILIILLTLPKKEKKHYGFSKPVEFNPKTTIDADVLATKPKSSVDGRSAKDEYR